MDYVLKSDVRRQVMVNRMILNEMVWFGWGVVDVLIDEVMCCGYYNVLIVIDKMLV